MIQPLKPCPICKAYPRFQKEGELWVLTANHNSMCVLYRLPAPRSFSKEELARIWNWRKTDLVKSDE